MGWLILILAILTLLVLFILSTRCRTGQPGMRKFRAWAYAHRGLHNEARPENSMSAFRAAAAMGYGIELDLHLLADGNVAVIHDSLLKRTTGAAGRIEDLQSHDLWQYHLEGSSEHIPALSEVLNAVDGKVPLLIELKTYKNNHKALCLAVCELLERYAGLYCIQSFDPRVVRWLRKNRPEIIRGQLSDSSFRKRSPWLMLNFLTQPDFISYKFIHRKRLSNTLAKKLWGASLFGWVITDREEYRQAKKEGWIPIFEGFEP